jgi:hypothetical protein
LDPAGGNRGEQIVRRAQSNVFQNRHWGGHHNILSSLTKLRTPYLNLNHKLATCSSSVVEHLTHNPKIRGSNPAADNMYHTVIFHFMFRNKHNGLLNLDPPLKKHHATWHQNYPSQFFFGKGSSPSISQSGFSIRNRWYFVLFKNVLDVNKVS